MAPHFEVFLNHLAERHRVLLLGGLAVIAHGLSRPTKHADAWLEPLDSADAWSNALLTTLSKFPDAKLFALSEKRNIATDELPALIQRDGVVRVTGLAPDLDVFRIPNNLEEEQFNPIWIEAIPWAGGVRVMNAIDLLVTKESTGRKQDENDIVFLEEKVRGDYSSRLKSCSLAEAEDLFARYTDHVVANAAMDNPDPEVQALGQQLLKELAQGENPFAKDLLRERGIPLD